MGEYIILVCGWLGFILCSLAYLLLNFKIIRFDSPLYQLLNLLGGIGLVVSAYFFDDLPNLAANSLWVLIAIFGVINYSKGFLAKKDDFE